MAFIVLVVLDGLFIYEQIDTGDPGQHPSNDGTCPTNTVTTQMFGVSITSYVLGVVFVLFYFVAAIECMRSCCSKYCQNNY